MKYEGSRSRRSILDTSPRRTTRGPRPELPKRRLRDATCARERSPLNGPPRAGPPWPRALVENLVLQCGELHRHAPAPVHAHAAVAQGARMRNDDMTSLHAGPTHDVSAVNVHTLPPKSRSLNASTRQPAGMRSDDIQSLG